MDGDGIIIAAMFILLIDTILCAIGNGNGATLPLANTLISILSSSLITICPSSPYLIIVDGDGSTYDDDDDNDGAVVDDTVPLVIMDDDVAVFVVLLVFVVDNGGTMDDDGAGVALIDGDIVMVDARIRMILLPDDDDALVA